MTDTTKPVEVARPEARLDIDLQTENLISTYNAIAEWIRFADAKAAVVLTVTGALASVLIPTLKDYLVAARVDQSLGSPWEILVLSLFILWLLLGLASSLNAFRCILPFRRNGRHPALEHCTHFHPAAISSRYSIDQHDQFVAGYSQVGLHGFQREVLAGVLVDSHISSSKYGSVTAAIRLLGWSALSGMLYLLASQF